MAYKTNVKHIWILILCWLTVSPLSLILANRWKIMKKWQRIVLMLFSPLFLMIYCLILLLVGFLIYLCQPSFFGGKSGLSDGKDFVDNERIERITGAKLYFRDIVDEEYDEPSFNGDYSNTYLVLLEKRPDYSALDSLVASGRWQKSEGGYHFSAIWGNDLPAPEGEDPNEDRMLTIRIPFDSDTISLSTGMW